MESDVREEVAFTLMTVVNENVVQVNRVEAVLRRSAWRQKPRLIDSRVSVLKCFEREWW